MGGLLISTLGTLSSRAYNLFLIIVAVGFFGVYIPWNEKKKREGSSQRSTGKAREGERKLSTPAKKTPTPAFRSESTDHEHITPTGPSVQRQLEQLETLKEAGLLTKEEYQEKRAELLEGRK